MPLESAVSETRVAATPETVKKFLSLGCSISIEKGAGIAAGFSDDSYSKAGAEIFETSDKKIWGECEIILCVQAPSEYCLSQVKNNCLLVGLLSPYSNTALEKSLEDSPITALALELLPRISRAQSADALSSQANIAGYKAVLIAASALDKYFPMLMTAAGTVQPAKIVVLGAGVAGLQAVATARRLGAVVFVSDIRPAVKEQVESLGGRFINPPLIESSQESGGYAKESSEDFLKAQRKELTKHLSEADVAICTAQVPGKTAPLLINEDMLSQMRPGSVVVDLAVAQGGNCSGSDPNKVILRNGVKLIGAADLPCTVPNHASSLYSRNLLSLLEPFIQNGKLNINFEDEIIAGCLISHTRIINNNIDSTNQGEQK